MDHIPLYFDRIGRGWPVVDDCRIRAASTDSVEGQSFVMLLAKS
jgi:hypothetical protein